MGEVPILMFLAPLLLCCGAERQYFIQTNATTWNQARDHCKTCYKELVTLTPDNIQAIVQNLSSNYWIGLRKNLKPVDSHMAWSRWANGDPLTFQNWYPGQPTPNPAPLLNLSNFCPRCECCCYSECNNTVFDGGLTFTTPSTTTPVLPIIYNGFIEDPCVVLLPYGTWFESNCLTLLPSICYEDRFYGNATVTDETSDSVVLTWSAGPGDISRYRLEVKGDFNLTVNKTGFTYNLVNMTRGTRYSVQVFPVKCERDLNPQNITFYTKPGMVGKLTVTMVTENSVFLSWSRPIGNRDFYYVKVIGQPNWSINSTTENVTVSGLTPGEFYTFYVTAGVEDKSKWGEPVSTTAYTKPSKVSNLVVSDNTKDSLLLRWDPPEGAPTVSYLVKVLNLTNDTLFNTTVQGTSQKVTGLPAGTKLWLSVVALANRSLQGESVTIKNFTAPGPITNLSLPTNDDSIKASWLPPKGNYQHFVVNLQLHGSNETKTFIVKEPKKNLIDLKAAARYTVTVYTVNGHLKSEEVVKSNFTSVVMPSEAKITSRNKSHITLEWTAPQNIFSVKYLVGYNAPFWGQRYYQTVDNLTSLTFGDLRAGTKYIFEVKTLAGNLTSHPVSVSNRTEAEKREFTLSMLCSSKKSLFCDDPINQGKVFDRLKEHFKNRLKDDSVFWELKWKET